MAMSADDQALLLKTTLELREALCASMRVIADLDIGVLAGWPAETRQQRFVDELHLIGITDGFGKRADELIKRLSQ